MELTQQAYLELKLKLYGMGDCRPSPTPLATTKLRARREGEPAATNKEKYASVVGGLNYPTHMSRPDFAGPLNILQRFTGDPSAEHEAALNHFMRYVKGSIELPITYTAVVPPSEVLLAAYADASFDAPDISQGKLSGTTTTGYVILMQGAAVSWGAHQQKGQPAISTAEAEYYASSETAGQTMFCRNIAMDLGLPQSGPTKLWSDNQAAIAIANNPVANWRTRHLAIRHHMLRELIQNGDIEFGYCPGRDMVADPLTAKPLSKEVTLRHRKVMLGL